MHIRKIFPLIPLLWIVVSCQKEEVPPAVPAVPNSQVVEECGTPGARLEAIFDGASWCPTVSLYAYGGTSQVAINGVTLLGSTLTLMIDSLSPGTYQMTEMSNPVVFTTSLSVAYAATSQEPVTLVITDHDAEAMQIKGTFSGNLRTAIPGAAKAISGSFDVNYVEQ